MGDSELPRTMLDGGSPDDGSFLSRIWAALHGSLSRFQAIVGLLTGLLSISGTVFSVPRVFMAAPSMGEVVAIVQDAKSNEAVPDATIEVLTLQNALITTLTPDALGRARHALKGGLYRVRVSHPRFAAEVRQMQVPPGKTVEVRVRLRALSGRAGLGTTLREREGHLRPSVSLPPPLKSTRQQSP